MKPRYHEWDREASLLALLREFYAEALTEGQLLRALRREVLGLQVGLLPRQRRLLDQALAASE